MMGFEDNLEFDFTAAPVDESHFKPIFDSLKTWIPDIEQLTTTGNPLGTTFPISLVLGSYLLPQRRRQGNSRRHKRFVCLAQQLTA